MNEYENERELIDYLNVIWKRKWLIIIPTFFLIVAVGIYSSLQPSVWEIEAIIMPSKFFIQVGGGGFEEILPVDPKQIAGQINEATYNNLIAAELNLDARGLPNFKAKNIKETKMVRISTRVNDVEKAMPILYSLFSHLKRDLDKKIDVEIKGIDTQVESKKNVIKSKEIEIKDKKNSIKLIKILIEDKKNEIKTRQNRIKDKENVIKTKENAIKLKNLNIESKEIEKKMIGDEIITLKNKFKISQKRAKSITEEMKEVKNRIDKIEEEQRKVLKSGSDKNALSILLYSNEIQNNLRYYNTLDEKLSNEYITQENINLEIELKKKTIKQTDNQIEQIRTQIDDIRTQIDDTRTQIDDIYTQIDNIKNEIGKIKNEINTINNGIIVNKNEIEIVRTEISYLKDKKARIDYAEFIKEPTSSLYPVAPKKKRNVILAGMLSLMIFTTLAFFLDYLKEHSIKSRG